MKLQLTHEICHQMEPHLAPEQSKILEKTLLQVFSAINLPAAPEATTPEDYQQNTQLINLFVAAKRIEGCSDNTIKYYANTLAKMVESMQKNICDITTNDLRYYLSIYHSSHNCSKVILDKFRRTMATMAIEKGMPIEQVQKLLGHSKIDTTMHYAIVNQSHVKSAHRKYIG